MSDLVNRIKSLVDQDPDSQTVIITKEDLCELLYLADPPVPAVAKIQDWPLSLRTEHAINSAADPFHKANHRKL